MKKKFKLIRLINSVIPILLFIFIFTSCSNSELLLLKSDIDNLKNEVNIERNKTTDNNNKLDSLVKIIKNLTLNSQLQKNDLDEQRKIISEIEKNLSILNLSDKNNSQEIIILQNKIDSLYKVINNLQSQFNNQQVLSNNNLNQNNTAQNINSNVNQNLFINNNSSNLTNGNLYAWGSNLMYPFTQIPKSQFGSTYAIPTLINEYGWLYVREFENMIFGLSSDSLLYLLNYDKNTDSLILDVNKNKFELVKQVKENEVQDFYKRFTPIQISKIKFKFIETMSNGANTLYCIDQNGLLWVYGENGGGEFGTGNKINSKSYLIKTNFKCDSIIANFNTVLAIKNDGTLWGWGNNNGNKICIKNYNIDIYKFVHGIIGNNNNDPILSPTFINNYKWIDLKIAENYVIGVKDDYSLWWWSSKINFLTVSKDKPFNIEEKILNTPRLLLDGKWQKVVNIGRVIALISLDNFLYLFGYQELYNKPFFNYFSNQIKIDTLDRDGKISLERIPDWYLYLVVDQPQKVYNIKFKDIFISNKKSSFYNNMTYDNEMYSFLLYSIDNELYGIGYNDQYNFGIGNNNYVNELTKLNDFKWEKIYSFNKTLFLGKRQ